ncbi:MAG: flavin-containing monooxygenase [Vicinamibacterales bacterium]
MTATGSTKASSNVNPFWAEHSSFEAVCHLDDDALRRIVADAELAPLLAALAQISGDTTLLDPQLRPPLTPSPTELPQGGMTPEHQVIARERAFETLKRLRAEGGRITTETSPERLRELMTFITGAGADEYLQLLSDELGVGDSTDPGAPSWSKPQLAPDRPFTVAIIGAGMSGIAAAYRLRQAEIPFVIFEKNDDVGGTWLENTYPGCRLDTSNFAYTYSFAPSANWDQYFTLRDPIHKYFSSLASAADISPRIRFCTEVVEAAFDSKTCEWTVHTVSRSGVRDSVRVHAIISAVGQLNRPKIPEITGLDTFAGPTWHSAHWDHTTPLAGKRVAVVGTGASAYQIVPAIADQVASLMVFQRTPPWMLPTPRYHESIPEGMRWLLREMPFYDRWLRFYQFWVSVEGRRRFVEVNPDWDDPETVSQANAEMRQALVDHLAEQLQDRPDLLPKMTPHYPPGAKRMLRDNGVWAAALKRDNVQLVTNGIREIVPNGVVTDDGSVHEVDIIIYATGFNASDFLSPMTIRGRNGSVLHEQWNQDPRAYLGITVPNFPNLFCLYGPNTALVVNGSAFFFAEAAVNYILDGLRLLLENNHAAMDVREDPFLKYNEEIDAANRQMAWGIDGVDNWYKGRTGRVTQVWPHSLLTYWNLTRHVRPEDYEFLTAMETTEA